MIGDKMAGALNTQLNREMYSAYLYMSMSAYSTSIGLEGFANWFMVQYYEEMVHAMKFYDYINGQGGRVKLMAIEQPPADFAGPLDTFEKTLKHEKLVTSLIHKLVELSRAEKDQATNLFLQWFVKEQVEEEENARDLVAKLKEAGDSKDALLTLDKELAARIFTPPDQSVER